MMDAKDTAIKDRCMGYADEHEPSRNRRRSMMQKTRDANLAPISLVWKDSRLIVHDAMKWEDERRRMHCSMMMMQIHVF